MRKYSFTARAILAKSRENPNTSFVVRYGKAAVIFNGVTYHVSFAGKETVNCHYMQAVELLENNL